MCYQVLLELAHKAIAFLLSYDEISCVIPGMRTLEQLESNLAAVNCRISLATRQQLEAFWDGFTQAGTKLLPW